METPVMAALIAAGAAVLVALLSWRSSTTTTKAIVEVLQRVEEMKRYFRRADSAEEISDKELEQCLEALAIASVTIQELKDAIQVFVSGSQYDEGVRNNILLLKEAATHVRAAFKDERVFMNPEERKTFHEVKDSTMSVYSAIASIEHANDPNEGLDQTRDCLLGLRGQLTIAQKWLEQSRAERLAQRTKRRQGT